MDVMKGEVVRVLQLADSSIVPVMMMTMIFVLMKNYNVCTQVPWIVPRKTYRDFHADIFPDTASAEPLMVGINNCVLCDESGSKSH